MMFAAVIIYPKTLATHDDKAAWIKHGSQTRDFSKDDFVTVHPKNKMKGSSMALRKVSGKITSKSDHLKHPTF